jgi:PAS domain S-box-containing protein
MSSAVVCKSSDRTAATKNCEYAHRVETPLRLMVVGDVAQSDTRALVEACGLPVELVRVDAAEVAGVLDRSPRCDVLLTATLTGELATRAHHAGLRVSVVAHGASSLREALLTAARDRRNAQSCAALGAMYDVSPIGIAVLDQAGRIVRGNDAFAQLLGRDTRSLAGLALAELEPVKAEETLDDLRRSLVDRFSTHRRLETHYLRGDGTVASALETVARVEYDGSSFGVAIVEDTTVRAAMESFTRTSERMRALVHVSVADVVFYLGVEEEHFRFLEINPAFTRATGLTVQQVVGKLVEEVIPEPSLSLVLTKYREAIHERRTVRWEEITDYPSGRKYGEVSVTPLIDANGKCWSLVGAVHDVTTTRRQEETIRLYADIVRTVQIALTVWEVSDPDDPRSIKLTAFNPEAERAAGIELGKHIGGALGDIFPVPNDSEILELVCDVARTGNPRELRAFRFPDTNQGRIYAVKAFPLAPRSVGLAAEDVSAEERVRALNEIEQRVLEMAAAGEDVEKTLTALVLAIEGHAPGAVVSILLLSADGQRFHRSAAPHLPEELARVIEGAAIGPRAGSCGTAAFLRRSVIVTDTAIDPLWESYRDIAVRAGVRACWSTPIFASDGRVLGTFALYYREPHSPSAEDLSLIARANHVAGIVLQRHDLDEQLRGLAARIETAREEERTTIARDIHDDLGQALTVLKMDIAWIDRRSRTTEGIGAEVLREKLRELAEETDGVIGEVRRISSALRPVILDDLGLAAALSWQAEEFERRTGISCTVRSNVEDEALPRELTTAVFRVFQEALTNVVRHAQAGHVEVMLEGDGNVLVLEVHDDGKGIRAEDLTDQRSLGLLGIRERARRLGGSASFTRTEPTGTTVTLRVPRAAEHT